MQSTPRVPTLGMCAAQWHLALFFLKRSKWADFFFVATPICLGQRRQRAARRLFFSFGPQPTRSRRQSRMRLGRWVRPSNFLAIKIQTTRFKNWDWMKTRKTAIHRHSPRPTTKKKRKKGRDLANFFFDLSKKTAASVSFALQGRGAVLLSSFFIVAALVSVPCACRVLCLCPFFFRGLWVGRRLFGPSPLPPFPHATTRTARQSHRGSKRRRAE